MASDLQFLNFFFARLKLNNTGRYRDFPYISYCGREKNFVRCDDRPIVFTSIDPEGESFTVNYSSRKIPLDVSLHFQNRWFFFQVSDYILLLCLRRVTLHFAGSFILKFFGRNKATTQLMAWLAKASSICTGRHLRAGDYTLHCTLTFGVLNVLGAHSQLYSEEELQTTSDC